MFDLMRDNFGGKVQPRFRRIAGIQHGLDLRQTEPEALAFLDLTKDSLVMIAIQPRPPVAEGGEKP
jgi:hypothetical protein